MQKHAMYIHKTDETVEIELKKRRLCLRTVCNEVFIEEN